MMVKVMVGDSLLHMFNRILKCLLIFYKRESDNKQLLLEGMNKQLVSKRKSGIKYRKRSRQKEKDWKGNKILRRHNS